MVERKDRSKPFKAPVVHKPSRAPCVQCTQNGYQCVLDRSSKSCDTCNTQRGQGTSVLCSFILDEYRQRQFTGGHERELLKQGTFDDFASKALRARIFELLDSSQDAQFNTTPNSALLHSNFKEYELRKTIASLSQTASEVQTELAMSATAGSTSECSIVIYSDSDSETTVKAPAGSVVDSDSDSDDCEEPDDYYDSLCDSLCEDLYGDRMSC